MEGKSCWQNNLINFEEDCNRTTQGEAIERPNNMSKRYSSNVETDNGEYSKRQKLSNPVQSQGSEDTQIRSASQLKRTLAFDQDGTRSKYGMDLLIAI